MNFLLMKVYIDITNYHSKIIGVESCDQPFSDRSRMGSFDLMVIDWHSIFFNVLIKKINRIT